MTLLLLEWVSRSLPRLGLSSVREELTIVRNRFIPFVKNHEFDSNETLLASFLANLTCPTVSTNIKTNFTPLAEQLVPFVLMPKHELAIVALTTVDVPDISQPGNTTRFEPLVESVQPVVDGLLNGTIGGGNETSVKRVVALTHVGSYYPSLPSVTFFSAVD